MAPETLTDALIECVKAAGGSKAVGVALWGSAGGVDVAQRRLLSCLNPERPEKLSLNEVLQILRLAREKGCHAGMEFLAAELGYTEPVPVDSKDEIAELLRQSNELRAQLVKSNERIERLLQGGTVLRSAA